MRILLIGNFARDRQESMLRYALLLERELRGRGHQVTLLQPRPVTARFGRSAAGTGKWLGYIDKFLLFPRTLRQALPGCDVVHICDHSNAMYTEHLAGKPSIVTCHDVLAIKSALGEVRENAVSSTGRRLQRMILDGLKRAMYIVCVSQATEDDLLRVTHRPASTVSVVHTSLGYPYTPMPRDEAIARVAALGYDAGSPFFLHVGSSAWYKNRLGAARIFDRIQKLPGRASARMLFVGDPLANDLAHYLSRKGLRHSVAHLAGLSNEDLRAVYSLAEALIFPSLQEGFGWPILEAQACGCPVFTTDRAPMTEVGGTAAIYFDPADPAAAAQRVVECLATRGNLASAGLENLSRFSIDRMIDGYLAAYARVLTQPEGIV